MRGRKCNYILFTGYRNKHQAWLQKKCDGTDSTTCLKSKRTREGVIEPSIDVTHHTPVIDILASESKSLNLRLSAHQLR